MLLTFPREVWVLARLLQRLSTPSNSGGHALGLGSSRALMNPLQRLWYGQGVLQN
jgi:hypothetical protein